MIIKLIDIPITPLNQLYTPIIRNKRPSICKSKRGREDLKLLTYTLIRQRPKKLLEGNLSFHVDMVCKNKKAPDIDGLLKMLLDSMEGIVYENDKQVVDLRVRKFLDEGKNEIIIEIKEI